MAGNDATSTELFPGWSSVVHQPADEPEETDLPSTVDIAAFSTGLSNVEPSSTAQNNDHSDSDTDSEADSSNSGTDASQSCSQSDSSDSDSSTTSQESSSRSPSPEFSVTASQTNGLRLKIATIRKPSSPSVEKTMGKVTAHSKPTVQSSSSSSESAASSDSDSDSDKSEVIANKNDSVAKSDVPSNSRVSARSVKDVKRVVSRMRTRAVVAEKKEDKSCRNAKKEGPAQSKGAVRAKLRQRRTRKFVVPCSTHQRPKVYQ
ncbi:hypothetical protein NQ315_011449 [Exocentrus adspersus]|uniref:Uncharacterized protein n=1 Tax=Exocentrus adspersus TaxID=1586481 RepID=A0AAV8VWE8_9CUCU|nr:hypothetical protein NQ315_011449 [Exocentrus adspersus]